MWKDPETPLKRSEVFVKGPRRRYGAFWEPEETPGSKQPSAVSP